MQIIHFIFLTAQDLKRQELKNNYPVSPACLYWPEQVLRTQTNHHFTHGRMEFERLHVFNKVTTEILLNRTKG
ncbi:MAG TPA: hypothetical protein DCG19_07595 [Cryomorphaceae bacterium]|nr:hypothetical protein [Owenweeksia sp.]MBF99733.1 hypothetical protein [Owenweeksia sp.]HAD97256.1 hypothetical protein [Cryomorphaceae bacterium]HBF21645.1 hypothetical protein [Cryomorphaceae bacterium]HCQ16926.1 hypothetical protein [Cryomorphaceae bacterium]